MPCAFLLRCLRWLLFKSDLWLRLAALDEFWPALVKVNQEESNQVNTEVTCGNLR